jgi:ectoine hydroxylase-related dioxygenase (phytanoyl-CoA dioxygenase family)
LSKLQLDFYYQNGYIIVNDILSEKECNLYYNTIKTIADKDFSAIMNPDRIEFLISQCYKQFEECETLYDKTLFFNHLSDISNMMRNVMKNKKAVKVLEQIQQSEVSGLMSQMLFKESNSTYSSQAWQPHQDNAYPKNKNGAYLTTNFFFKNANKENGSLFIYRGSHLNGLINCTEKPSYREPAGSNPGNNIPEKLLKKFEKIDVSFNKGDMLVLHGNCVHGSYPNLSKNSRPLLSCSYITKGESFIPGKNAQRKEINLH